MKKITRAMIADEMKLRGLEDVTVMLSIEASDDPRYPLGRQVFVVSHDFEDSRGKLMRIAEKYDRESMQKVTDLELSFDLMSSGLYDAKRRHEAKLKEQTA